MTNWLAGMEITAARLTASTMTDVATYTPAVTNGGTVTWTTQTGWYYMVGDVCFFTAYLVINNVGSGASTVTVAAPVSMDRTTRQVCVAYMEGITSFAGTGVAVAFTGGSGAVFDRVRKYDGTNLTGAGLTPTAGLISVQGWVRQA